MNTEEKRDLYVDEGEGRRYWTMIPNMILEIGLSPYAIRLYLHLKRVCGETGRCWQTQRSLAISCEMSPSQICRSKQELLAKGLIYIAKGNKADSEPDTITIVDIWLDNMLRFKNRNSNLPVDSNRTMPHEPNRITDKTTTLNIETSNLPVDSNRTSLKNNSSPRSSISPKKEKDSGIDKSIPVAPSARGATRDDLVNQILDKNFDPPLSEKPPNPEPKPEPILPSKKKAEAAPENTEQNEQQKRTHKIRSELIGAHREIHNRPPSGLDIGAISRLAGKGVDPVIAIACYKKILSSTLAMKNWNTVWGSYDAFELEFLGKLPELEDKKHAKSNIFNLDDEISRLIAESDAERQAVANSGN